MASTSDTAEQDEIADLLTALRVRRKVRLAVAAALSAVAIYAISILIVGSFLPAFVILAGFAVFVALWSVLSGKSSTDVSARRADQLLRSDALLTTGAEVSSGWTFHRGPVAMALLHRAREQADRADARSLVPVIDRGTVAAAFVAVASWGLLLGSGGEWASSSHNASSDLSVGEGSETPETETRATVRQISELAALIETDAEMSDIDILDRSAAGLRDVARRAGRGELAQGEIDAAVAEHLAEARLGYPERMPAWLPEVDERSTEIGARLENYRAAQAALTEGAGEAAASGRGAGALAQADQSDVPPDLPPGAAGGSRGSASPPGGMAGEDGAAATPGGDFVSAGASTQSGRGVGDRAGLGRRELGDEAGALPSWEARDEVLLSAREPKAGAMLRLEVGVDPSYAVSAPAAPGSLTPRPRTDAAPGPVVRERIRPSDRAAVAGYFSPEPEAGRVE